MLDVELLRKQPEMVRANLARRHNPEVMARLDEFLHVVKTHTLSAFDYLSRA